MAINIQKNIPLAPYTTFKIGGLAKTFIAVDSPETLREALVWAREQNEPLFFLGGGSNILISDQGFDGCVIHLENAKPVVEGLVIRAFAGTLLSAVVDMAHEHSLKGLQNVAGVPGSVGGAVRGNAGAFGTEMEDVVSGVDALHKEAFDFKHFSNEECHFSYRMSVFKEEGVWIVAQAEFSLESGDQKEIARVMEETIAQRNARQDQSARCAGSFFMNPVVRNEKLRKEFEEESGSLSREDKVPAGWLIDRVGLRGKRMGGAMVSESHPNYILNVDNATAEDVIMLASFITQQVRRDSGVQLMREVQFVGFDTDLSD